MTRRIPRAITIAGSDSGGGAGIQADLKTFAALGVYGTSVLTAVTAQNTVGVLDILELPVSLIRSQMDAVITDIGTDAAKTGMLSSAAIIEAVAEKVREHRVPNLVVDPVMVAKSGDRLLREEAVEALRAALVPLARVVTPNAHEASVLVGWEVVDLDGAYRAAETIAAMGAGAVVVKGGHLPGPATDVLFEAGVFTTFTEPRVETTSTHGTGCTFASATAAGLARGLGVRQAVADAKRYVTEAIRSAFPMGHGHGPLNHFHAWWG